MKPTLVIHFHIGFSIGSIIARSIVVSLWDSPLNMAKTLSDNVTCISFGPVSLNGPHAMPIRFPQLLMTFHSFIIKDDVIPKLSYTIDDDEAIIVRQRIV